MLMAKSKFSEVIIKREIIDGITSAKVFIDGIEVKCIENIEVKHTMDGMNEINISFVSDNLKAHCDTITDTTKKWLELLD